MGKGIIYDMRADIFKFRNIEPETPTGYPRRHEQQVGIKIYRFYVHHVIGKLNDIKGCKC